MHACMHACIHRGRPTDRRTDRHADMHAYTLTCRQPDRSTGRHARRHEYRPTYKHTDLQTYIRTHIQAGWQLQLPKTVGVSSGVSIHVCARLVRLVYSIRELQILPCPCKNLVHAKMQADIHTAIHTDAHTHTDIQTCRQTDIQASRHTSTKHRQTDMQTDRCTGIQTYKHRQTDRQTEIHARYMYAHVRMRLTQWNMSRRSSGPEWQEAGLQGCLKLHSSKSKRRSISGFGALLVGVLFWESRAVRR